MAWVFSYAFTCLASLVLLNVSGWRTDYGWPKTFLASLFGPVFILIAVFSTLVDIIDEARR